MKTLTILIIPFILFASGETMKTSDHMFLSNSDKRPFKQLHKKSRMHQLHQVDEKETKNFIKKLKEGI